MMLASLTHSRDPKDHTNQRILQHLILVCPSYWALPWAFLARMSDPYVHFIVYHTILYHLKTYHIKSNIPHSKHTTPYCSVGLLLRSFSGPVWQPVRALEKPLRGFYRCREFIKMASFSNRLYIIFWASLSNSRHIL